MRANMVMRRFGWYSLHLQTMGVEAGQKGQQMAAPLIHVDELEEFASNIHPISLPERFQPVSPLTIRRFLIRSYVALALVVFPLFAFWSKALWGLLLMPVIFQYAIRRYKNHGFHVSDDLLYVRRGVIQRYTWAIPINKFQVFYTSSSYFQRRLDLCTVYVDTAGVNGLTASPEIIDLPIETAETLLQTLNDRFQRAFDQPKPTQASEASRIEQSPK